MVGIARWFIAGMMVLVLVPLAVNEWRRMADTRARDAQVLAHLAAARGALVDGRPEHALVAAEAARRLDPLDIEVQSALREAHVRVLVDAPERLPLETAVAAAHTIQQALPRLRGPEAARHQVALGNLAALTGHDPLPWYKQALSADPASLPAHLYLGLTLLAEGAPEQAESHLATAHEAYRDDLRVLRALGLVYAAREKWDPAAEVLARVAETAPDREVHDALGRAWMAQRKYTVAAEALERALDGATTAELASLHALLAEARHHIQQYDLAVEHFETAWRLAPTAEVRLGLAKTRAAQEEWGRAERLYRSALEADPGSGPAHVGRLTALRAMGRADEARTAVAVFRGSLRGYPGLRAYEGAVRDALKGP